MSIMFLSLSSASCILLLLLSCSFLSTSAQKIYDPVEWAPEVFPSEQCGLTSISDLSDSLETVAQLVKNNDIASSLPKSCMEIKENSPVSPSGYYTISTGSGSSVVVYCNMDELYSCPTLEQTLQGFSSSLLGYTNTVTGVSSTVTDVASTVTGMSNTLTEISNTLEAQSTCTIETLPMSCQEVQNNCPDCTNRPYKILAVDLTEKYVYCSFEDKCGTAGPWTRVAYLNMSDSSSVCPSGTQKFVNGSAIACGAEAGNKCVSITTAVTHTYSQICGQVVGYQKGSPTGFATNTNDIDRTYLDGVSVTLGQPRQHVWSYAVGLQENYYYPSSPGQYICPCGATSTMSVPSFVGSDYYCESGEPDTYDLTTFLANDILWDGKQCGVLETGCCGIPGQPWFHKVLGTPLSDRLEIRLCLDQPTTNENILVSQYELYIK